MKKFLIYKQKKGLINDIPAGDGKIANLFYSVYSPIQESNTYHLSPFPAMLSFREKNHTLNFFGLDATWEVGMRYPFNFIGMTLSCNVSALCFPLEVFTGLCLFFFLVSSCWTFPRSATEGIGSRDRIKIL